MLKIFLEKCLNVEGVGTVSPVSYPVVSVSENRMYLKAPPCSELTMNERFHLSKLIGDTMYRLSVKVVELPDTDNIWSVEVEHIEPPIPRAPRAFAPGITVEMNGKDVRSIGSVCDVSQSGLLIRSLVGFEVGELIHCKMEIPHGLITFVARVARLAFIPESSDTDIGVEIREMNQLDRARYNFFVESMVRKSRSAA
jgi:hypothetical protein